MLEEVHQPGIGLCLVLSGLFLKNVAKIVKLWKAQSRCTGIEDRQSQVKKPEADQNKQHNKK